VQLFSAQLRSEITRLKARFEPDDEWPFRLVGRRETGSQNTWMHNARRIYPDSYRFAAHLHPADAEALGARDGDDVRLVSKSGSVVVPIVVVDTIRQGTVSLPNGWGHRDGSWRRSTMWGGVNSNDLVDPEDVEAVAGMSILNGIPIRAEMLADRAFP
jgi:formate dehydrogenase